MQSKAFAMRRIITGSNEKDTPEAVINPKTKELMTDKAEILQVTLEYTSGILQYNPPCEEHKKNIAALKFCHSIRMKRNKEEEEDETLTYQEFEKEMDEIRKKGKHNYDDLIKAGNGLKKMFLDFSNIFGTLKTSLESWT